MVTQAVILVGGLGTRLGEMTRLIPKPLLEVAGRPFLDYILDELSRYPTIQDIVLLAGHQAGQVVSRYDGRRWRGATVSVVSEPSQMGTGGALKHAALRLNASSCFSTATLSLISTFSIWPRQRIRPLSFALR